MSLQAKDTPETELTIRPFEPGEGDRLRQILFVAVREGAREHYSLAQRVAWAVSPIAPPGWEARLGEQITLVAENRGLALGFLTLGRDGHLDLFYVVPDAMGTDVAPALHDKMLAVAADEGMSKLTVEASHLARRFLEKNGWRHLAAQTVVRRTVEIPNHRMERGVEPPITLEA